MRAGLLGRTLGHSLSPQIHKFFGDYDYRLYEREPDEVAGFLRNGFAHGEFDFLNVTIPYKQTVFALCDELMPIARKLGNVNFVRRNATGGLLGDNTDAFGVERLLDSLGIEVRALNCAILGAGGAALTARAVLEMRGAARVTLVRRGECPAQDDELIVNATPVGMWPHGDEVRINIADYPKCRFVLDLVYNPSPTRLVREARALGKDAADGLVMLIAQAYGASLGGLEGSEGSGGSGSLGGLESLTADGRLPARGPLFLYGPPASGKSTLARKIAAATGWTLIDLDEEIVRREGRSIPEIFASAGEAGFRAVEKRELRRVAAAGGQIVVSLGGGSLLDEDCRRMAETAGRIVVLDCPVETLKRRLTGGDRPLSADAERLERLVAARAGHYASFPVHVQMP